MKLNKDGMWESGKVLCNEHSYFGVFLFVGIFPFCQLCFPEYLTEDTAIKRYLDAYSKIPLYTPIFRTLKQDDLPDATD